MTDTSDSDTNSVTVLKLKTKGNDLSFDKSAVMRLNMSSVQISYKDPFQTQNFSEFLRGISPTRTSSQCSVARILVQ